MLQNIFRNNFKNMYLPGTRARVLRRGRALPMLGTLSGLLNGFLGTGGGMVLSVGLRAAYPGEDKVNMATATASMMFLSFLSTILYSLGGHIGTEQIFPIVIPALLGGALGSLFLGRIRHEILELLLGGMLLYSGLSLLL